jgi:hypothetical protein
MADTTQAPTLEKLAIAPSPPAAVDGAGAASNNQDQVSAAFRFGWAIEELVGRLNTWPPLVVQPQADDFPPDLTHERSPEEQLRELVSLLKANGKQIVGTNDEPPLAAMTLAKINNLLTASAQGSDTAPFLKGDARIGAAIPHWNAEVVDAIIDQNPAVLTAYELGKALSLSQCRIRGAATATATTTVADPFAEAWGNEFSRDRITRIRRHLETLAPSIDARTVAAVSASLSFWSRAYHMSQLVKTPSPQSSGSTGPQLPTAPDERTALMNQLDAQLSIWYDLLSGRRQIEGFPVTGVVSDLVRKYATSQLTPWTTWLLLVLGIVVVMVLVAGGVAVLLGAFNAPTSVQPAAGGLAGGVTALTAFLAARGAGLLDRGTTSVQDLQARVAQVQTELASLTRGTGSELPPLTFRGLAGDVLANVVEQIRLEESKIAISQPLVDYVMGRDLKDPPQKVMQDFLTQILGTDQTSNLERLQNVLQGLYKDYRPEISATI